MSATSTRSSSRTDVRTARHAYYAAISYVDDWVGTLLDTLDACGLSDDTVILFTADHGDLLGERGLWYKMSFFEGACRIPLIVAGPGITSGGSLDHVSLSTCTRRCSSSPPWSGRTRATRRAEPRPAARGRAQPERTVLGEYLAEGAVAPIFMIRRGDWKFVYCAADPPQLYDLAADPDELVNLAADPQHADTAAAFEKDVLTRWDPEAMRAAVIADQHARRAVDAALRTGRHTSWDHDPGVDAAHQYMRNHLDLNVVERSRRLPPPG